MNRRVWSIALWVLAAVLACIGVVWWMSFRSDLDATRLAAFFEGASAIATFLAAAAVVAAFAQVREARKAIRDNRTWNRMNAAMNYVPSPGLLLEWELELDKSFVKLISRADPISDSDVKRLFTDEHASTRILLKSYLNVLERYCLAVNSGIADAAMGDRIWGYKIVRHFNELEPYIRYVRNVNNNRDIYKEIQRACEVWSSEYPPPKAAYPAES